MPSDSTPPVVAKATRQKAGCLCVTVTSGEAVRVDTPGGPVYFALERGITKARVAIKAPKGMRIGRSLLAEMRTAKAEP